MNKKSVFIQIGCGRKAELSTLLLSDPSTIQGCEDVDDWFGVFCEVHPHSFIAAHKRLTKRYKISPDKFMMVAGAVWPDTELLSFTGFPSMDDSYYGITRAADTPKAYRIEQEGEIPIFFAPSVSVERLVRDFALQVRLLMIDIEGNESNIIKEVLKHCPNITTIRFEAHSEHANSVIEKMLLEHNFGNLLPIPHKHKSIEAIAWKE